MDIQNDFGTSATTSSTSAASGSRSSAAKKASETMSETARRAEERVEKAAAQAGEKARQTARQAQDEGWQFMTRQKTRLSEHAAHYSHSTRAMAEKLREEDDANLAGYADSVAVQLDRAAGYLRERDLGGMLEDIEDTVRRRPEVFFGGMFIAGMAFARFLKASGSSRRQGASNPDDEMFDESRGEDEEVGIRAPGHGIPSATSGFPAPTPIGLATDAELNPAGTPPASGPELSGLGADRLAPATTGEASSPSPGEQPTVGTGGCEAKPGQVTSSAADPHRRPTPSE